MGYTHYMGHHTAFTDTQWLKLCEFTKAAILATDIPIGDAMGEGGEPEISDECIHFNGVGEDSYEDFYLSHRKPHSSFCKTERKPYDAVVVAVLLYANEIARDHIASTSDGDIFSIDDDDQWDERTTANTIKGETLKELVA